MEGGTFALYSLICRHAKVRNLRNQQAEDTQISTYKLVVPSKELKRALKIIESFRKSNAARTILLILALLGTYMVIGDGVLTPCISGLTPPPNPISKNIIIKSLLNQPSSTDCLWILMVLQVCI